MSYSTGPYSHYTSLPVPDRPTLYTARSINPQTKRYEMEPDGGYTKMRTVAQRILMLVSFNVGVKKFNTPHTHRETEDEIRKAIKIVVDDGEIEIISIEVSSGNRGTQRRILNYNDLTAGTKDEYLEL